MFDYILFDFDGTVFDTVEGITKSVKYAINKQGLDAELDELRCFAGPPLTDMFMERFGFELSQAQQATADFRERYLPVGLYECRVFPGIKELILALKAAGKQVGLATSKPQVLAEELLNKEGMLGLFDAVSGSSADGSDSTKAYVLGRAMELLSAERDKTVLVGDTKYDVLGAKDCGVKCIGVRYGYAAKGELESAGADIIVRDIPELERLLLNGEAK